MSGSGTSNQGMEWLYDQNTAKPKDEDYLLGKSVDANFEKGTLGQINAVEYGKFFFKRFPFNYHSFMFLQIAHRHPFLHPEPNIKLIFNASSKKIH